MAISHNAPPKSLQSILDEVGGPVKLLRGSNLGPYTFPVITPEFKLAGRSAGLEG
ncbi:hypothetical protein JQ604_05235 [Bradyrhizobium jicamae]|uniref:hypothetical protein n=1 Tax=Bradyrhizobium jicamae TaxID=280332 RepID=UPI001BA6808C|nr:hypothetical protein [Bradyrhizobium jicamae]MBR0751578.1 hypothetical protein [Bradyrhizobium jicamae]